MSAALIRAEVRLRRMEQQLARRRLTVDLRDVQLLRDEVERMRCERGLPPPWRLRRARYLRETGQIDQLRMEGL